jgi:hypothetical protein
MANIPDTVSIQPDTVTLSGYSIWNVDDILRNPVQELPRKLLSMTKAAENFKWVAEDLSNLSAGQTRTSLVRLLKYYLQGMRHAVLTASNRRNNPQIASRCDKLDAELNKLEDNIQHVVGGLAALPSGDGHFDIPNRSVLELLIHARYESLPQNLRPTTLGKSPSFNGLSVG